jgi:hypothetical protein
MTCFNLGLYQQCNDHTSWVLASSLRRPMPTASRANRVSLGRRDEQVRQLRDIGGDAPGLVAGEQMCRRAPSRLLLEIDVGERLAGVILHDETGIRFLDGPGRREAAGRGHGARIVPQAGQGIAVTAPAHESQRPWESARFDLPK